MKNTRQLFVGIDVSKEWFDAALCVVESHIKGDIYTTRFDNDPAGVKALGAWLKTHGLTDPADALLVMENTGIYHRILWAWCSTNAIPVHIGNAAHIKWSLGITRGKDDKTDAIRLCRYAIKECESLQAAPVLNPAILRLKDLWTSRSRLLRQLNANRVYLGELRKVSDKDTQKTLEGAYKGAMDGIRKSIDKIEAQIKEVLKANEDLSSNYKLLLTVPGIGHITAVYLICCTANFITLPSGKQLSCYAGLAPFERSSGKSIKSRAVVHKMSNKELKRLLHMGALSSIKNNVEMKAYYARKVAAGKHELSVLNAIKSKMLLRVAAVVNSGKPYVDKLAKAA